MTTAPDIRARASYVPFCQLCSFPDVNILIRPGIRTVTYPKSRDYPEGRTAWKLDPCCMFSAPAHNYFASEAEAVQCWREQRLKPLPEPALENRRRSCTAKLAAAGLEAIE